MLHLSPLHADINRLGLGRLKLRFGGKNGSPGSHTARVLVLCQFEEFLIGGDGRFQKLPVGVECAELEVVLGQLGLNEQPRRFEVCCACLGACPA